ncbi:MAG TPA: POTRA domain-containing protein, partial [Cytophagaceae bacterium]
MKHYNLCLAFLKRKRIIGIPSLLIFCTFTLYNCSVTKHLEENQYLLYKQTVKGTKNASADDLIALYRQKPNRKVLGTLPYLKAYYIGKAKHDTVKIQKEITAIRAKFDQKIAEAKKEKKQDRIRKRRDGKLEKLDIKLTEGNWLMRTVGEPPSIFDTSYTMETARQFRFYLNSKGYFNNSVSFKIDTNKRFVTVAYNVVEGEAFKINQVNYNVKDSVVANIILQSNKDIKIKIGENYDEGKISEERERINKLLKNTGYYDFTRQYIFFEIDTTIESKKTAITIRIENPPAEERHKQYSISKIVFNTDVSNLENIKRDTSNFKGVDYVYYDKRFSKKILDRKIKIYPGDLYNQSRIQLSQRQLGGLDMYKFVNVNFDKNKDTLGRNTLTAYINASPLKKYQISDEAGLNISYGFVPGPFGSLSFK